MESKPVIPIRNEINTRFAFAKRMGEIYFDKMVLAQKNGGNPLSCKAKRKFDQACRIYDHYLKEFNDYINK